MAFITIESSSKTFSFELNKNPKTGLQALAIREGVLYGFFSHKAKRFNLYFMDHPLRCSFNEEQAQTGVEYNDLERYSRAEAYLTMLDKGISIKAPDACKQEVPTQSDYSITLNTVFVSQKESFLRFFQQAIQGKAQLSFEALPDAPRYFKIVFSVRDSNIYNLLQITKIFLVLLEAKNDRTLKIDDQQLIKYLNSLIQLDPPYALRNLFRNHFLTPTLFRQHKDLLETSQKYKFEFQEGSKNAQRRSFLFNTGITEYKNQHVLELTASDFVKMLYKKMLEQSSNFSYTVVTEDEDYLEDTGHLARKNNFTIITKNTVAALDNHDTSSVPYTVLYTDIADTLNIKTFESLKEKLRSVTNIRRVVLLLPNNDFMKAERTTAEIELITGEVLQQGLLDLNLGTVTYYEVGDRVEGVTSMIGVVIDNK